MANSLIYTIPIQRNEPAHPQQSRAWETTKEIAFASLPFLTLYKPFSFPVALGVGSLRVGVAAIHLANAIKEGDPKKVFSEFTGTMVAVISLAATIFAHPLGLLISTGYDLIVELRNLIQYMREGKHEEALRSALRMLGHAFYFAVFLYGGPEIAICFLAVQLLSGFLEARHEFKNGHIIAGIGHALMGIVRGNQLYGQIKTLQLKWEIQQLIKKINTTDVSDPALADYVGKLADKWQFPSDHLPVGAKVGNVRVISWNVLNNNFMSWITELDSQGLKGSLISKLDAQKSLKYPGLTLRDELVAKYIFKMAHNPRFILSLQECSPEFVTALDKMKPQHMGLVAQEYPATAIDHNIVLFDKRHFTYLKDESTVVKPFTLSDPKRPLLDLAFVENGTQQKFQIINVHIPGDPNLPGKNEFARYVLSHMKPGFSTIAQGDMNFTETEMQLAFDQEAAALHQTNPFKNLAHCRTNINPGTFTAKGIDHIWVNTPLPCTEMAPNEILPDLQSTVNLLYPEIEQEAARLKQLEERYRIQQLYRTA